MAARLQEVYQKEVVKKLVEEFKLGNVQASPRIIKVVINCGLGEATGNPQVLEEMATILGQITGQKPVKTLAKHAISAFKLRKGQAIGLKVTLRGRRMYDFLEKLFKIVLPRLRDFRGAPISNFDKGGNYTLGVKELTVFPEVATLPAGKIRGLEVTIVTDTNTNLPEKSKRLLELLGMPFAKS